MQVSHVQDHCTHAVIGGKQSIEFGISNSAEFFNILSSTLYKDQILAVVRETLCNAWDAHIEAGCTDRPVQITLDNDTFTIKDFGKGIHHDDMGLIYGTYGNSTKKNDGMQTGGFGLGCKSPFAYTDHFEVISNHAGIKTVYNLSKSSAQAMGKPEIIPIASFPTEESGLTVSIRIQGSDFGRFKELITRIVHNGDMNMTLNGKQLDTIGFDVSKGNYLILHKQDVLDTATKIMVRYGNVIYPIDSIQGVKDRYLQISEHLNSLQRGQLRYQIIFQAPAHSISVTPSRESLSMQEHTVNTLNNLFSGFLDTLKKEFPAVCDKYAKELIEKVVAEQRIDELLIREDRLPFLHIPDDIHVISNLGTMASAYMQNNYPQGLEFRKADITRRLQLMVQEKLLDRGKVQTFLLALKGVKELYHGRVHWHKGYEASSWLQRRVVAPLLNKLSKAGLNTKKLYVCDSEDDNSTRTNREKTPPLVVATNACPKHLLATIPYLRNIIVISNRRDDLVNRAYRHEAFKGLGNYEGFLVYNVGRKTEEIDAARKFFTDSGMRVVDLTVVHAGEKDTSKPIAVTRTPTKKGLACLSSIVSPIGIDTHNFRASDAVRIENPEFVIQISIRQGISSYRLQDWDKKASQHLVALFGDKGGITTTSTAQESWIKKGAKDFKDYVREKVCDYILNNPRIQEYWAFNQNRVNEKSFCRQELVKLIYSTPSLMKEFGLVDTLSDKDRVYLLLWEQLLQQYRYTTKDDIDQVKDWLAAIPLASEAQQLITKLNNYWVGMLNVHHIKTLIQPSNKPVQVEKTLKILISVLNS